MSAYAFTTDHATEALLMEQAEALVRELVRTADDSADGQVLTNIESLLLSRGRDFLRKSAEITAQAQAAAAEKKGYLPGRVGVADAVTIKAPRRVKC